MHGERRDSADPLEQRPQTRPNLRTVMVQYRQDFPRERFILDKVRYLLPLDFEPSQKERAQMLTIFRQLCSGEKRCRDKSVELFRNEVTQEVGRLAVCVDKKEYAYFLSLAYRARIFEKYGHHFDDDEALDRTIEDALEALSGSAPCEYPSILVHEVGWRPAAMPADLL